MAADSAFAQGWTPRAPEGQPSQSKIDEARKRYDKGIHLYEVEGDVATALVELQRAYDIAPNFLILFNIGQVARTGRDYVTSQRAFAAYLAFGGPKVPADRRETAETELRTLKGLVATLKIFTDVSVGAVLVDDIEVAKLPAAPVHVNPGTRRVVVQSGSRSAAKSVTIAGGEEQAVEILLGSGPAQPQPQPQPQPEESGPSYVWIGWGATGLLAVAAIVTGTAALVTKNDLDDTAYVGVEPPEDLSSQRSRVTALSVSTDVLIGAAAVGAGVTLYFTIKEATSETTPADRKPAPVVGVQSVRITPAGVSIAGSF